MSGLTYRGCQCASHAESLPEAGYPLIAEPKLDGFRMLVHIDELGEAKVFSRNALSEPYTSNLDFVVADLVEMGFRGCIVDGEVVSAGSWNETAKLVRLKSPTAAQRNRLRETTIFNVFDYVDLGLVEKRRVGRAEREVFDVPFERRRMLLDARIGDGSDCVRVTAQRRVWSREEAQSCLGEMLELGFEGLMLKDPMAPYVFDRHQSWLAVKPKRTVDAQVVGVVEGQGKHAGRLGALKVRDADGVEFSVGTGFDDAEREEAWARRESLVGMWVEAEVQACDVATARHPVFVRWRLDRD